MPALVPLAAALEASAKAGRASSEAPLLLGSATTRGDLGRAFGALSAECVAECAGVTLAPLVRADSGVRRLASDMDVDSGRRVGVAAALPPLTLTVAVAAEMRLAPAAPEPAETKADAEGLCRSLFE